MSQIIVTQTDGTKASIPVNDIKLVRDKGDFTIVTVDGGPDIWIQDKFANFCMKYHKKTKDAEREAVKIRLEKTIPGAGYEIENNLKIHNNDTGEYMQVGADADGLDLVEIRCVNAIGNTERYITMDYDQAVLLVRALDWYLKENRP